MGEELEGNKCAKLFHLCPNIWRKEHLVYGKGYCDEVYQARSLVLYYLTGLEHLTLLTYPT